jgi:hypothetical protein
MTPFLKIKKVDFIKKIFDYFFFQIFKKLLPFQDFFLFMSTYVFVKKIDF